jgi:hypothetical protein
MDRGEVAQILNSLVNDLAAIEHERWSHWQSYLHGNGVRQSDGSLVLPRELVDHWERQIATKFEALSEKEKESDREQVRKYLPVIVDALSGKP